jgi:hypothetical protein
MLVAGDAVGLLAETTRLADVTCQRRNTIRSVV